MNNINQSVEGKTKNITLSLVCAWIFGIIAILVMITAFNMGNIIGGILLLVAALITLPPTYDFFVKKTGMSIAKSLKVIIFIILLVAGVAMQPSANKVEVVQNDAPASVKTEPKVVVPIEYIKVSAMTLYGDYKANEVAADAKYKDKYVETTGTIETIGKDILDTPYVSLKGDPYYGSVQCVFNKTNETSLATLSKGQSVTLQGKVSGKLMNIIVTECKLVN